MNIEKHLKIPKKMRDEVQLTLGTSFARNWEEEKNELRIKKKEMKMIIDSDVLVVINIL